MPRYLIYAEGQLGTLASKTGNSVIRYAADRVAAILDSSRAGNSAHGVLGYGGSIPVVASVAEGVARGADSLLVGIARHGGGFGDELRVVIREAIQHGLHIWNGLHAFVRDDPELAALAVQQGVLVHDVRRAPTDLPVGTGRVRDIDATVVLAVGSDANIGKMTVMLQMRNALAQRGARASFAPTGQTGIFIEAWGICIDAVVADFIAGAAEQLTMRAARNADIVLVEGQGSVLHPGYSGVSLGLLHGSLPHALIACHQPGRLSPRHNDWMAIPPLEEVIALHEALLRPLRPATTIGVSLNTSLLSDGAARAEVARVAEQTGLPTTDPVRFNVAPLADAILAFDAQRRASVGNSASAHE